MPIYNAKLTSIDTVETKRYAGLRKDINFDEKKIVEACEEAQILIDVQGNWEIYNYDYKNQTILSEIPVIIEGKSIGNHLNNCDKVICMAITIGENIEKEITKKFQKGEYTSSILLDAAATTAVEQAADTMEKAIGQNPLIRGYSMRWRFSPGYGDWSLSQQKELFRLSNAEIIGIRLSTSMMMIPRKSVTAIIGLSNSLVDNKTKKIEDRKKFSCENCNSVNCPNRKI